MIVSLPHLLAVAHGNDCVGDFPCVLCGAPASVEYQLPESFTTRDSLFRPGSAYRCRGCERAMEESGVAVYHDGSTQTITKAYRRMCSWVVTANRAVAATKAHRDYLRQVCLAPLTPPYAISLAVSGQKQLLYRGVVNWSVESVIVTLEGEWIGYRPTELKARLDLCGRLVAATGKPALDESPTPSFWFRVCERYQNGESLCEGWATIRESPLARLASFLTPRKEECDVIYPSDRLG